MLQDALPTEINHDYDRYRDAAQGSLPDRFVVFHIHFNERNPTLTTAQGRTFPATPHVNIFHGRYTFQDGENLRVYNRDHIDHGRNERSPVFACHGRGGGRGYPIGGPTRIRTINSNYPNPYSNAFHTWTHTLELAGYLRPAVWRIPYPNLVALNERTVDWSRLGNYESGVNDRALGRSFAMHNGEITYDMGIHNWPRPGNGHSELK
jgi:hypothetical protein